MPSTTSSISLPAMISVNFPATLFTNGLSLAATVDYSKIGRRIARRCKELGLRQVQVFERAGINDKYLSCIERATSIPSLEVIMKLALTLDTTPDESLTGSIRYESDEWRDVTELMRGMSAGQLVLAKSFLTWLSEQNI